MIARGKKAASTALFSLLAGIVGNGSYGQADSLVLACCTETELTYMNRDTRLAVGTVAVLMTTLSVFIAQCTSAPWTRSANISTGEPQCRKFVSQSKMPPAGANSNSG